MCSVMLSYKRTFLITSLMAGMMLFFNLEGQAQNSRDVETRRRFPTNLQNHESSSKKKISKRKAKKKLEKTYAAYFNRKVTEYEERMVANVKRNNKMAKEMNKERHRDPSYFGHKKPPKKRANGKKRKCKECHMWH